MISKKNKFFTLLFSMAFGAGQMYMGFMKLGVSLMSISAAIIFFGTTLNIGPIIYALPVIWFYSFFDSINKMSLPDEQFYQLQDHYLFIQDTNYPEVKSLVKKYEFYIAILLIVIGTSILGQNILDFILEQISYDNYPEMCNLIESIKWDMGRLLFALVIIVVGIRMILGKKKELDNATAPERNSSDNELILHTNEISPIKETKTDENA